MTRLANADEETFWAHHAWSDFALLPEKERTVVILPIHGYADHGLGLPLDAEEVVGSEVLRQAVVAIKTDMRCLVLPPLRFGLAPIPATYFGIDPETGQENLHEIAESVRAAGFRKLAFFCTSPWNAELIDATSRDIRAHLELQTFVVNLNGLGLDFHPASGQRGHAQAVATHLLGLAPKASQFQAAARDLDFRPGNWRQPPPLAADHALDGARLLADAGAYLGRLLTEIEARPPLSERSVARTSHQNGETSPRRTPPRQIPAAVEQSASPSARRMTHSPPLPQETPTAAPSASGIWPPHRTRYLTALTRDELIALPNKNVTLVVIPTGAIEQHGHHLPVGVDALLGQALLDATLPKLASTANVMVGPSIVYGKSNEHIGFPGTVFISAKTLRRLLLAIARQLKELGFGCIGILNTHGGNSAVLVYTLREIQATLGLRAGMIASGFRPDLSEQEREYGFHGGEWETSLMLAAANGLVRMDRAAAEYPARIHDPGELRPENAPAIFSWISSDISRSGIMGDPTKASPEKGRRWLAEASSAYAQRMTLLAQSQ